MKSSFLKCELDEERAGRDGGKRASSSGGPPRPPPRPGPNLGSRLRLLPGRFFSRCIVGKIPQTFKKDLSFGEKSTAMGLCDAGRGCMI